ncbi:MAG: NAD(P)/FAD-dependent oxidoreductase [Patescibacteria group bacterium]
MTNIFKTQTLVIGAGSAGLTTAIGLAKVGYKVIIVEKEYIGGDCTHFGCVPSKALLYRAKKFAEFKAYNQKLNLKVSQDILEQRATAILNEVREVVWKFAQHESVSWLEEYGVKVISGEAKFENTQTILVKNIKSEQTSEEFKIEKQVQIKFDKCVICTGSTTRIPDIQGLTSGKDNQEKPKYLTNKTVFKLQKVPKSITIIGNGAIGTELSEAFLNLGAKVNLIGKSQTILPRSENSLAQELQSLLVAKGLNYLTLNVKEVYQDKDGFTLNLEQGKKFKSEQLLIATGRQPNLPEGLESAKVEYTDTGIVCNNKGQTSNSNIYVAGDIAANYPNFTHYADHMGGVITTNLAIQKYTKLPINPIKFESRVVPSIIFTTPELAACGLTEMEAIQKYGKQKVSVFIFNFNDLDRAKTQQKEQGRIQLVTIGFFSRIVGVHILASRAGEILPELQRMVKNKSTLFALNKIIRAYPSYTANLSSLFKEWLASKIK